MNGAPGVRVSGPHYEGGWVGIIWHYKSVEDVKFAEKYVIRII